MKNQKTIQTLTFKKTTVSIFSITGGLPIENNITRTYCNRRTVDSICHCPR
ncbi:hypothetical protein [uncultured Kordia sp.]|uniref:hypothetical protein n=1 Tax=uncultured Kordia sp. TaxID=507699 RepID=UPI002620C2DC|nr:hypothetical protein [uncultured Kordia sp.]